MMPHFIMFLGGGTLWSEIKSYRKTLLYAWVLCHVSDVSVFDLGQLYYVKRK